MKKVNEENFHNGEQTERKHLTVLIANEGAHQDHFHITTLLRFINILWLCEVDEFIQVPILGNMNMRMKNCRYCNVAQD